MLLTYKTHISCDFDEFATNGTAYGIAPNSTISIRAIGLHRKLYVLSIRTDVVAEAYGGFISFYLTLGYHPRAVYAITHISVHFAKKGKTRCFNRLFVEVEIHIYSHFLAEEVSLKRALSPKGDATEKG